MHKEFLAPLMLSLGIGLLVTVWSYEHIVRDSPTVVSEEGLSSNIQWRAGVAQQYQVLSESSLHMEAATSSQSSINVQLNGLLDTFTLEVGDREVIVGMRLSSLELKINESVDTRTNFALSAPFRVHFASNGFPVAFEFPAEVSSQDRTMLENLVRTFQVSMAQSDTWIAGESNGNGFYEAVYRRSGPLRIDKSKREFRAPSGSMMAGAKITSTEQLHIDPARDWIISMRVDEALTTSSQSGVAITVRNHATLQLQRGVALTTTPNVWQFDAAVADVDDTSADVMQLVPEVSVEDARKQIHSMTSKLDATTHGRMVLVHRLRDLLRIDESLPTVLLDILRTQQLSDRTRADLYLVLDQAGTDGAQSALVSVFTDNTGWSLKDNMRAIVAMGGVAEPNRDSIAALWNVAQIAVSDSNTQRTASAAAYALGSLGNTMRVAKHTDYGSLRSNLLTNALSGVNDKQRSDFVFAVGNTQDTTLANEIVGLLDDKSPTVRRATALSLGMLGVDQTADTLVSRFQQEDNSRVRSAIAESLVSWSEPTASSMAVFTDAIRTETDESTRNNLVRILGENIAEFPEGEVVLKQIMRTETSKTSRQKIADMLSGR